MRTYFCSNFVSLTTPCCGGLCLLRAESALWAGLCLCAPCVLKSSVSPWCVSRCGGSVCFLVFGLKGKEAQVGAVSCRLAACEGRAAPLRTFLPEEAGLCVNAAFHWVPREEQFGHSRAVPPPYEYTLPHCATVCLFLCESACVCVCLRRHICVHVYEPAFVCFPMPVQVSSFKGRFVGTRTGRCQYMRR